ncbi:methyl-accepting chemotaxis protein [Uliginosibacterium aquaticum]|uniref:HAMP domain-containing protein n=1 Tax=Uliginosibacterium aquaticum TaxID=2731212 RepID=A0ABX2IME0_9RHOO|nr:methyl-accepting chemotaxis protein [Uliginosibacterium aquaticum]NSL55463.1 HAMP domain-containing protein [Uliginosibacterium aquaticum]
MKTLLAPLLRLFKHLNWNLKFAIVGSFALIVMVLLVSLSSSHEFRTWQTAKAEREGLAMFEPTLEFLLLLQQHRGMSAGALGGNAAMRAGLDKKTPEVEQAARAFASAAQATPAAWALQQPARTIMDDWQKLREGGIALPGPQNFAAHTQTINALIKLVQQLNDVSGLALDPEAHTYYAIAALTMYMPEVTERLGKLRGAANGILAAKQINDNQREALSALSGELALMWQQMRSALHFASQQDADARKHFETFSAQMDTEVAEARKLTREEVLSARFGIEPAEWWKRLTDSIGLLVKDGKGYYLPRLREQLDARASSAGRMMLLVIGGSGAGALLLLLGLATLYHSLREGLDELSAGTQAMSQGDFTQRMALDSRDELGCVATGFNTMCDRVEDVLRMVQNDAQHLQTAAAALTAGAAKVSDDAEQQSSSASAMAAAVEQMSVSLGEISHYAGDTESASSESRQRATESNQMVSQVVTEMSSIASVVEGSAASIRKLGERSEEIAHMISVIREIADQTNLLALNAAIEAARAGEQGRGFAVVADEVRKLAERTTQASNEIVRTVNAIRQDTAAAAAGMEQGVARVQQGSQLSAASGERMLAVCSSADRVLASVAEINTALREHRSTNESVAQNVEHIARMSEHVYAEVSEAARTASELNKLADELLRSVANFRVRTR